MPQAYFGDQMRGLDYSKTFKGRVVNRTDPMMEGRVGVFIPELVIDHPADAKAPSPATVPLQASVFDNASELTLSPSIKTDIYIWARPANAYVENGAGAASAGGGFGPVPQIGTVVEVYFEDRDPAKAFYRSGSPTIAGDVTSGRKVGQGTNLSGATSNWTSAAARPNIHVIRETPAGDVIYFDSNPNVNAFVIHFASGHTISVQDAQQSGIILETAKGATVHLDDPAQTITIRTQTGKSQAVMKDDGTITFTCNSDYLVQAQGKGTFQSKGDMTLQTDGKMTLKAGGDIDIQPGGSLEANVGGGTTFNSGGAFTTNAGSNNANPPFPDDDG